MGKTGKWFKSFLTGSSKKEKEKEKENNHQSSSPLPAENHRSSTPIAGTTPKEKRRWSFRRSSASRDSSNSYAADPSAASPSIPVSKELSSAEKVAATPSLSASFEAENEQKKHAIAVAAATAAAADAAVAAAHAAAAVIRLTTVTAKTNSVEEEAAAIKIQSAFRSYLAKKALNALKGLVKLQALVRGHLVRKQATETLRCMQALVTAQARARAQRLRMSDDPLSPNPPGQPGQRRSPHDNRFRQSYDADRGLEENIKIVEMDLGASRGSFNSRNSYSNPQLERVDHRFSTHYAGNGLHPKLDSQLQIPPSPSALTDLSPRTCSAHFDEYSYATAQSSPQCFSAFSRPDPSNFTFPQQEYADSISQDYPFFPNYMANTESSRAKARSQSAPKQRPDSYERQTSKRRPSVEGRNIPRGVRMQRSSSHVGAATNGYQNPWSIKLDRSTVSLKDSECGSTSTVFTHTNYCRSLVGFEVRQT